MPLHKPNMRKLPATEYYSIAVEKYINIPSVDSYISRTSYLQTISQKYIFFHLIILKTKTAINKNIKILSLSI